MLGGEDSAVPIWQDGSSFGDNKTTSPTLDLDGYSSLTTATSHNANKPKMTVHIGSSGEFSKLLSSSNIVITDCKNNYGIVAAHTDLDSLRRLVWTV